MLILDLLFIIREEMKAAEALEMQIKELKAKEEEVYCYYNIEI